MIGLVTDSASQIPPSLASRLGVQVVPITVTIDGIESREGVDLSADEFWAQITDGRVPEVSTSQPSPGAFGRCYRDLVEAGVDEIVSVHVGAEVSGTVNAASVAADLVEVPVHVVDSGTASFGVTVCVWRAAEVLAAGGSGAAAAVAASTMAPSIGTSFVLQGLDFARSGGRFDATLPEGADDVIVLSGHGTGLDVSGAGRDPDTVCDLIVAPFLAAGGPVRAAVGLADDATLPLVLGIEERLRASESVVELLRYRVGPSIAAHTGPGTAGGFWWPAEP